MNTETHIQTNEVTAYIKIANLPMRQCQSDNADYPEETKEWENETDNESNKEMTM